MGQNESRIAWESFSLVFTVCYLFLSFLFPFHGLSGIRDPDHGEERKEKTGKEKNSNKRCQTYIHPMKRKYTNDRPTDVCLPFHEWMECRFGRAIGEHSSSSFPIPRETHEPDVGRLVSLE